MLSESPEHTLRMTSLAAQTNSTLPRLSHVVRRLEDRGLLERFPCPEDARATNLRLTAAGWDKVRQAARGHVANVRQHVIHALTPEQVAQLRAIGEAILGGWIPAARWQPPTPGTTRDPSDRGPESSRWRQRRMNGMRGKEITVAQPQPRAHSTAGRCSTGGELTSEEVNPLTHRGEAATRCPWWGCATVVGHLDAQRALLGAKPYVHVGRRGVPRGVGERLADDPVRRDFHGRTQRRQPTGWAV